MRYKLIELTKQNTTDFINPFAYEYGDDAEQFADHLLANGVIVKPNCSECLYNDSLNWHQCEECIGDKSNRFVPKKDDFSKEREQV